MRKAAFKYVTGLVAASGVGEIGGLGQAAAQPGKVAFNTTAEVEEVEDEKVFTEFKRPKIEHDDKEIRDAVEELRQKFIDVLQKGPDKPEVQAAVAKFLPTTDAPSLMRFVVEAMGLLDSIQMKIETNVTM
eukprot:TRINITY_DN42814_c0_g1_i1.p2 TRINITY_DN42814_c0_g1~~TRINITY_DN42814_c0_g1_i1.p2  ORF type:complete len:131 (+),score=43.69 TRINITY_DN42814_c0_g1_i1:72-464(+)